MSSHLNACLSEPKNNSPTAELNEKTRKRGKRSTSVKGEVVKDGLRTPPPVSVAAIVGGMSAHKQRRVLSRGVDVLVATPGRLWDLLQEVCLSVT